MEYAMSLLEITNLEYVSSPNKWPFLPKIGTGWGAFSDLFRIPPGLKNMNYKLD